MATRKKSPSRRAPAEPDASRKTNGSTGQKTDSKRGRADSKRGRVSEPSPRRDSSKRPASRGMSSENASERRSDSRGSRKASVRGDSRRIGSNGIRSDDAPSKTPDMVDAEADKMKMYVAGAAGVVLILVVLLLLAVSGDSSAGANPYDGGNDPTQKSAKTSSGSGTSSPKSNYDWTKDPDNIVEFEVPAGREESFSMGKDLETKRLYKRSAKCLYHYADFIARDAEACTDGKERQKELYDEAVGLLERAAEIADKGDHGKDLADMIRRKSSKVNSKVYAIFKHGSLNLDEMRKEEEAKKK